MDLTANESSKDADRQVGVEVTTPEVIIGPDAGTLIAEAALAVEAACDVLEESGLLEWGVNPCSVTVRLMIESALRVSAKDADRQAGAKIEITEEMNAAGAHQLAYYYPDDLDHDQEMRRAVTAIYKAMTAVRV